MFELEDEYKRIFGKDLGRGQTSLDRVKKVFFQDRKLQIRDFQQVAISRIAAGCSALVVAGTAQGKTEAVIVPVAARLLDTRRSFMCCYLAPTRALLNDLQSRLQYPLEALRLRVTIRHGDRHIDQDDPYIDLLLTTPESLDVMLTQQASILQRIRIVVIDEVHQSYGTPRGAHIVSLLERLKWTVSREKSERLQRIALSATVGNPTAVAAWLQGTDQPLEVITSPTSRVITASAEWCETDNLVSQWIANSGYRKVLAFVNSRRHCEELASSLTNAYSAEVLVHYSDLRASDREYVENRFRRSDQAICVATGTLELGIDIGDIDAVAMADPAFSVQAFLQRIGRAARSRPAVPVLMPANSETCLVHQLALLSLASEGVIEDEPYPEWFSVLAQQILSMVASGNRSRIHELVPREVFGYWPWFGEDTARLLLDGLTTSDYLQREEQIRSYRQGRNMALLMDGWGISTNIAGSFGGTPLYQGQRKIGSVEFGANCEAGEVLRYAGRFWTVQAASPSGIRVAPSPPVAHARLPRWSGRSVSALSRLIAQRMRAIVLGTATASLEQTPAFAERRQEIQARAELFPSGDDVIWENTVGPSFTYYTFAGHLENEMLRLLLDEQGLNARLARGQTLGGLAITSNQALTFSGAEVDQVRRVQAEHWRGLRRWTQAGPMFDHIPTALRRREVLSQMENPEMVGRLSGQRPVAPIATPVFRDAP